jgi:hypothetical protein
VLETTSDGSKKTLTPSTIFLVAFEVAFLLVAINETMCPLSTRYLPKKKDRMYDGDHSGAEPKNTMRKAFTSIPL